MNKRIVVAVMSFLLVSLSGCGVFSSELDKAAIDFMTYDGPMQTHTITKMQLDDFDIELDVMTYEDGALVKEDTSISMGLYHEDPVEETDTQYYKWTEDYLSTYYANPNLTGQYIEYQEALPEDETYDILLDTSDFTEEEDGYHAVLTVEDVYQDYDYYLNSILLEVGSRQKLEDYYDIEIPVVLTIQDERIHTMEFDFQPFVSELFLDLCDNLDLNCTGDIYDMTIETTFTYDDTRVTLPSNVVLDNNLGEISDDMMVLALDEPTEVALSYSGDIDAYRINIPEDGLYEFDITETDHVYVSLGRYAPSVEMSTLDEYYYSINLNSRTQYLLQGTYYLYFGDTEDSMDTHITLSVEVRQLSLDEDDYTDSFSYKKSSDIDFPVEGSIQLSNDYPGDIDTLYIDKTIHNAFIKVSSDTYLLDYEKARLYGSIEGEDYNIYALIYDSDYDDPSWSITLFHSNPDNPSTELIVIDPLVPRQFDDEITEFVLDEQMIVYTHTDGYTFTVLEDGAYLFTATGLDSADRLRMEFYEQDGTTLYRYIVPGDDLFYLYAGTYVVRTNDPSWPEAFQLLITVHDVPNFPD